MIAWTIKLVMDAVEQPAVPASSTLSARKAMLAGVEAMISGQPEDVKAATRAAVPALAAPTGDRWRRYAVYLSGEVGNTTYVLVEAVRLEMYP